MKLELIQKAYQVWVHSDIGEYPVMKPSDVEIIYAENSSEAKSHGNLLDGKNEYGEKAKWIDIKCKRVKSRDKIKFGENIMERWQYENQLINKKRNDKLKKLSNDSFYYVQDSRTFIGNSMSWWAKNSSGYTTDISNAHKYTKDEIVKRFSDCRKSDIIWEAKHIEENIKQHVDSQYLEQKFSV